MSPIVRWESSLQCALSHVHNYMHDRSEMRTEVHVIQPIAGGYTVVKPDDQG